MNKLMSTIQNMITEEFSAIPMAEAILAIGLSFVLGLFVVLIYKVTYGGVCFSKSFAGCLIMLSMVTALVILVIASNVVLSLGMVGALSIVRFRTAIKEPSDTAFAFWAIATGIVCGAGYTVIACLMTVLLGTLFVAIHVFSAAQKKGSYMVVVRYNGECKAEGKLSHMRHYQLKNKNMTADATELVAEIMLTSADMKRIEALRDEPGVQEITIMSSVGGSVL
ncbi:MAG: DUF4956 domain-containing protein [Oscillospiraceae bacterium]|nr:DUF4956 domain-containing protein [Oscillospiraceae bacterium]